MPLSAIESTVQAVQEKRTIRQIGQRIVKRIVLKLFLCPLAVGNVPVDDDEVIRFPAPIPR